MAVDYGEDFLQRIVGVHWRKPMPAGTGVFVAGDSESNIRYLMVGLGAKIDDHTGLPIWVNLGPLDFLQDNTGVVQGSSYAVAGSDKKPVFVLVGGGGRSYAIGIIMASADGLNWTRVYQFGVDSDTYQGANIFAVVWDEIEKVFYAAAHQSDRIPLGDAFKLVETDVLLMSRDGYVWSEAGRSAISWTPPEAVPEYRTGLLASHCSRRVTDSNGNGLPDGFYKYDSTSKIMIAPTSVPVVDYLSGRIQLPATAASSVAVTNLSVNTTSPPSNTGFPTYCVAQTAGVAETAKAPGYWLAGGGIPGSVGVATCQASFLVLSAEPSGVGWKLLDPPDGQTPIITMVGGQAKPPPI